jgi:medium-chain acyl-[acyl-carrier-protein] hydrolase
MVDKKSMNLQKMPVELMKAYGCSDDRDEEKAEFEGLKKVKNPVIKKDFSIRYTDIDRNMHVNNTNYMSWAINSIPKNIVIDKELKKISILYRKEGKYGEDIIVETEVVKEDMVICNQDIKTREGELLCQIKTKWS